jgi:hypothetical protein
MNKPMMMAALVVAAAATTGCNTVSGALGMQKVAPDEFRVVTRAPLTLPPDYALRPPAPGEPRPQELQPDAQARAALFGQDVGAQASAGERSLVTRAGAEATDPTIRDQVDFEAGNVVHRNSGYTDRVLTAPAGATQQTGTTEQQEAARRATGGGNVTIQREGGGGPKLPGT